jgi:lipopolysaccharide export system permease protein
MKLWFRYLFQQLLKTFLFILISVFIGYVLVDLSVNGIHLFSKASLSWIHVGPYYLQQFATHLELFFPLSFLLASMKVLLSLNSHQELVSLQMAGLSKKRILLPFFCFAALLSLISYLNTEWVAPNAREAAYAFRASYIKGKKNAKKEGVYSLSLENETELIYQQFDAAKKEFFDVFWVRSINDIWHMKYLQTDRNQPIGRYVDHFLRNEKKQFEKVESFETKPFPELTWNENAILQRGIPFEHRALSILFQQAMIDCADKQRISSHLHYKMALPLLPFLVLFAISPLALRFSRGYPTFLFVACSLFAFIALMTVLEGMLILGENQVLPAHFAIWGPLLFTWAWTLRPFAKL